MRRASAALFGVVLTMVSGSAVAQEQRPADKALTVFRSLGATQLADPKALPSKHRWRVWGRKRQTSIGKVSRTNVARNLRRSFERVRVRPELTLEGRDRVYVFGTMVAQQRQTFRRVPSRGATAHAGVFYLAYVRDGEIVESTAYYGGDEVEERLRTPRAPPRARRLTRVSKPPDRVDRDGLIDMYRVALIAVASRNAQTRGLREKSFAELKADEIAPTLELLKIAIESSGLKLSLRETFAAGPYTVGRFRVTSNVPNRAVPVQVAVLAKVEGGRLVSARAYFDR